MEKKVYDIPVKNFEGKNFILKAVRLENSDFTPVILWEGFYQNGYFFDLIEDELDISKYIWEQRYDVWVINSRGNGGSTGKSIATSMDDFAADDIPTVIDFVKNQTGKKPIYIGHSQGGNTALMSMMGAKKNGTGEVYLSDEAAKTRQESLEALVTLGSFLDMTFSKHSSLQVFVKNGVVLKIFGRKIKIISSTKILNILGIMKRLPVPVPLGLRMAMLKSKLLRIVIFPLTIILNLIALAKIWEFLFHIPNVSKQARKYLFYKTQQATYWGILAQYQRAIFNGRMMSLDKNVNYSENYHRITLPISVVTMEYDSLADPEQTKTVMFPKLGSKEKYYTEWMNQGHEDFVMNKKYFNQVVEAIKILNLKL